MSFLKCSTSTRDNLTSDFRPKKPTRLKIRNVSFLKLNIFKIRIVNVLSSSINSLILDFYGENYILTESVV